MPLAAPILLVALGYAGFVAWLTWRVARPAGPTAGPADHALPHVAVVVAARDEEAHLPRCLDALGAQDYPAARIRVWVADDHSRDGTAGVVQAAATRGRVHYVRVPDPVGPLRGKAQAIHTALEAIAETAPETAVVLITDADCAPVPTWARRSAARFLDGEAGLVCGVARIECRPGRAFDRVQALDWLFMLGAASALAEAGHTATGMGNNMAIRRAAYQELGGYPALPFSVTEDFTLVRAVAERTRWRVRFPLDPDATVWTHPVEGLRSAYLQRQRWARGGLAGGAWVVGTYALLHLVHLLPLVGLVVAPGAAALALALKVSADVAFLTAVVRSCGEPQPFRAVARDALVFEAFLFTYMVTLPWALLLRPRIEWKGRRH